MLGKWTYSDLSIKTATKFSNTINDQIQVDFLANSQTNAGNITDQPVSSPTLEHILAPYTLRNGIEPYLLHWLFATTWSREHFERSQHSVGRDGIKLRWGCRWACPLKPPSAGVTLIAENGLAVLWVDSKLSSALHKQLSTLLSNLHPLFHQFFAYF